jgi:hypothetical protein
MEVLPSDAAYRKLLSHYSDNAREINYVKFCEAIDDTQEYLAMTRKDPNPFVKQTCNPVVYAAKSSEIEAVEKKI